MGLFGKLVEIADSAGRGETDAERRARLEAQAEAKARAKAEAEAAKAEAEARKRAIEEARNKRIKQFEGRQKVGNCVVCDDIARVVKIERDYYLYEEIISANLYYQGSTETKASLLSAALLNSMLAKRRTKGVCTRLTIQVGLSYARKGTHTITFISKSTKEDSRGYRNAAENAHQIVTKLEGIAASNVSSGAQAQMQTSPVQAVSSAADEIRKFKELLDDGIITQEEFEAKRKELLGL